jgi:hypothetical protein
MIRTLLLASVLALCFAPVAAADVCVAGICIPPEEPPRCHIWDACGPPPCDSCDNAPARA